MNPKEKLEMSHKRIVKRYGIGRFTTHLAIIATGMTLASCAWAQPKAYLTDTGIANPATVIDTAANTVLRTIPMAGASKIAISANGARAYVLQPGAFSMAVIDIASDTVIQTISLSSTPSALAITPDGRTAYVGVPGAVQVISLSSGMTTGFVPISGTVNGLAVTPSGSRLYVTAGGVDALTLLTSPAGPAREVNVIDTASNAIVATFVAGMPPMPGGTVGCSALGVAISPNGQLAYVTVDAFYTGGTVGFSMGGGVAVVDTATNSVMQTVDLKAVPGEVAFTPDGTRAYVGIASTFVNLGFAGAPFAGNSIAVVDTANHMRIGSIVLGADGQASSVQNTAAGIAVTPDRSEIYVVIPRLAEVAVVGVNTNTIGKTVPVSANPYGVAITPAKVALVPYVVHPVDDVPPAAISSNVGLASLNVLANDTLGAAQATLANVTLTQVSSTTANLSLNTLTGNASLLPGAPLGAETLVYQICDKSLTGNCSQAHVIVTVRASYAVRAADDAVSSLVNRIAIPNVLSNDTFNGGAATLATLTLSTVSSSSAGIVLSPSGAVSVAQNTPAGVQTLRYQICETAEPANCASALVTIQVLPSALLAANDSGTITRAGGVVVASVLGNDTLNGAVATPGNVTLTLLSTTNSGVTLNAANGSVSVAPATPTAAYTLTYRICEAATPTNCASAAVAVTVTQYVIIAVNDSAAGFSNLANTALRGVLENDTLGGALATTANVTLSQVSLTPANPQIQLEPDGAVQVLGPTTAGIYSLVYKICEIGNATNCSQATVTINLTVNKTTTFKISVSKNGKGTVTTSPTGTSFPIGTVVTLTATPDPGQPWVGWGGACSGTATTCSLTMNSDKSVTANFR
jgi:DNA-binding beta-propeller fold protein YncE